MSFAYVEGSSTPNLAGLVDVGTLDGTGATGIRLSGGSGGTFELLAAIGLLWGSPGMDDGVFRLSNDHGGFAGVPLYQPREFSLVGEIVVPVLADMWGAIDLLLKTFNLASTALKTLTLNTTGWSGTRQIAARLAGDIQIQEPADKNGHLSLRRRFVIPMIAPDPRMYSTTLQAVTVTSGGTSLTNNGNMPTPFSVKFNGAQTTPLALTDPSGNAIGAAASPTLGHFINVTTRDTTSATATALDDLGASVFSSVTDWSASTIAPGTHTWTATKGGGAGTTVVSFRDAYA